MNCSRIHFINLGNEKSMAKVCVGTEFVANYYYKTIILCFCCSESLLRHNKEDYTLFKLSFQNVFKIYLFLNSFIALFLFKYLSGYKTGGSY